MVVTRGWWERGMENYYLFNGYRVSVGEDEKVSRMRGGDSCIRM